MKKSFMTRALAAGLSFAMAFSMAAANGVTPAAAAAKPEFKTTGAFEVLVGQSVKFNMTKASAKSYKITKAKVSASSKIKATPKTTGVVIFGKKATDGTWVRVTFQNKTNKKTVDVKKKVLVKEAAPEVKPEDKVEEVVKATKITEAKAVAANTVKAIFDGAVTDVEDKDIVLKRGATVIDAKPSFTTDKNELSLLTTAPMAAGTYTLTVGKLEPVSFQVEKQVPKSLVILNEKVANTNGARVYFQILDQYGNDMKYTDKKLNVSAYNTTKGHDVVATTTNGKEYFTLNTSTTNTASNVNGDSINIVAYLKDNASISVNATLTVAHIYTETFEFTEVKLGNDKRVTTNGIYEIAYSGVDTEGTEVVLDETKAAFTNPAATGQYHTLNNITFISSNMSAVDINNMKVDKNGKVTFVAGNASGKTTITCVNNVTGKTSIFDIVVNAPAQPSKLDIAEVSIGANTYSNKKVKAAVVVYDQFGDVVDAKNCKNMTIASYFANQTAYPVAAPVTLDTKLTNDGLYVTYIVNGNMTPYKDQTITFGMISTERDENGQYIQTTSKLNVSDKIEGTTITLESAPATSVLNNKTDAIKMKFSIKDQYGDKIKMNALATAGDEAPYYVRIVDNSGVTALASGTANLTNAVLTAPKADATEFEYKVNSVATIINALHKSGIIKAELLDKNDNVVSSIQAPVDVVMDSTGLNVTYDKSEYKAGETVVVTVDAYTTLNGAAAFNAYYNEKVNAVVAVSSDGSWDGKSFNKTLQFKNGSATFELPAEVAAKYQLTVTDQNAKANVLATTDIYTVKKNDAAKIAMRPSSSGAFYLGVFDAKGNELTMNAAGNYYATFKVMDTTTNEDITKAVLDDTTNTQLADVAFDTILATNRDFTAAVTFAPDGSILTIGGQAMNFATGGLKIGVPATHLNNVVEFTMTINGMTYSKKFVAAATQTFDNTQM